jgi:regulator of sigma E protease
MDFVYFIVLVGVLIFVHESGHFLWAKLFGVRVLTFSLGFGPRIAGFSRGGTDYVLAAIPLGGYVRMLGEDPHDDITGDEEGQSFKAQVLWKRIIIVFAGPMMNLMFPVALYFVVFLGTTTLSPPIVGDVFPGQPAEGKLKPGDRVLAALEADRPPHHRPHADQRCDMDLVLRAQRLPEGRIALRQQATRIGPVVVVFVLLRQTETHELPA